MENAFILPLRSVFHYTIRMNRVRVHEGFSREILDITPAFCYFIAVGLELTRTHLITLGINL